MQWSSHAEEPDHILSRRSKEHGVVVRVLNRTVSQSVIEHDGSRHPGLARITRNRTNDVPHVGLAVEVQAIATDVLLVIPFRQMRLPDLVENTALFQAIDLNNVRRITTEDGSRAEDSEQQNKAVNTNSPSEGEIFSGKSPKG